MTKLRMLTEIALGALMMGGSSVAYAAADDATASAGNEDIVVTATRREEKLQNVPVAVSAFTPDSLTQKGVLKAVDLIRVTPSLQASRFVGSPTGISFGIRGQRTNDLRINADSAVVTYIAEIPQHLPFGIGISGFLDLSSVQVLRGPQGTLFGKNSTGGAVLLTPNAPTDRFEGNAKITAGTYGRIEGQAVANLPLGEGIALRLAGIAGTRNGYVHDRAGGPNLNSENYAGGRISLKVESGNFVSTTFADYISFHGTGNSGKLTAVNPSGLAQNVPATPFGAPVGIATLQAILAQNQTGDFWSTNVTRPLRAYTQVWGLSNTSVLEVSDSLKLKNIIGYRDIINDQDTEANGTTYTLISTALAATGWQMTEEIQAQYDSGPIHLIGGFFYFKEAGTDKSNTESLRGVILNLPTGPRPAGAMALYNHYIKNDQKSVYLEGTLDAGNLHLTAGGRYTWDYRYRQGANLNYRDPAYYPAAFAGTSCRFTGLTVANCFYSNQANYRKFTHNLTARYEFTPDQQAYVSWRTGYRAGGFALEATSVNDNIAYNPETVNTYEMGYKAKYPLGGDSGLRLNLAGYLSKYKDIQKNQSTRTADGTQLITRTVNAAKATIYGFEAEAAFYAGDNFTLDLSYAYLHAKYDEWLVDGATAGTKIDNSATPWGYAPKHKLSASMRYTVPLGEDSSLSFQPSVSWQSQMYVEETPGPGVDQPGYALVNGRIEYAVDRNLKLGIWGTNLTNKKYYLAGQNIYSALGYSIGYVGEPRMFGVDLSAKF